MENVDFPQEDAAAADIEYDGTDPLATFPEFMNAVHDDVDFPDGDFSALDQHLLSQKIEEDILKLASIDADERVQDLLEREQSPLEKMLSDIDPPKLSLSAYLEVAIPQISPEKRSEYHEVYSEIVERVISSLTLSRNRAQYNVEYTDGREDLLMLDDLIELENGESALYEYQETESIRQAQSPRQDEVWDSDMEDATSDLMDLNQDDELDDDELVRRQAPIRQTRLLRSREASRRRSPRHQSIGSDGGSDGEESQPSQRPTRMLRTRKSQQMTTLDTLFDTGRDELSLDVQGISDEDGDFLPVVSDLATQKGRPNKRTQRSKRRLLLQKKTRQAAQKSQSTRRKGSEDSDIEFEAPRRSSRATRNVGSMHDDSYMDDDSFYVIDDKSPAAPKVISIREVFQSIPTESPFGSVHMDTCHTCSGSKQRGQLLFCQGCSLSFHKMCIGYRSTREHQVTKVGEDDFVLQCRFCIRIYQKKDAKAPDHSMCQTCKGQGSACAAFSTKKNAKQEEKMREENNGVDPVTPVRQELINNPDLVMFRCVRCYRAWHPEHLPSVGDEDIVTDIRLERLADYSADGYCKDCSAAKHKLHRLVAWRPVGETYSPTKPYLLADVSEDHREYLVKWQDVSYAHCTWKPGAWIYGVAAGAMRTAFGKRALEQDLLKRNEKEAIPDEYLLPDVILNVKMESGVSKGKSKETDLVNISKVSKIFVKYQGLGYDDVVWDAPPLRGNSDLYNAFVEAYHEYIEGKFFQPDSYARICERIKTYKSEPFTEVDVQPAGLKRGKLMGYQMEGLNWLLQNYHQARNVVLADEMGLGKTVQVVSLVTSLIQDSPRCWPFLITVPNSTCPNWRREFKQWAPDIRVVTYHGGREPQELAYEYELFPDGSHEMKAQVVIMSYDSAQDPRTQTLFKSVHWAGLVVDEGQRLKNDKNILYQALKTMKIPFRLLLTGTPLQNNKRELFNLLQFIDEKQNAEKLDAEFEVLDKHNLPKLHDKIRPYFLRRTKAGVLKFLPPMAQIILPVTMTVIQEKLSKNIMSKNPQLIQAMFANSKMSKKERGSLNNILMQLRKCLCHPFMYSEAIEERHHDSAVMHRNLVEASAKLLLLELMLPKLKGRGHRVLIFSQFLNQLDIIEDFLAGIGCEYRRLDGQISSLEKQRRIDAYNEPGSSIFAFLLSTRAGGVGINLATADTVIIMDPDFNPHQDMQALSRAHRIGQKNKVLCFQLMTKDSVEERIMQMGRKKMALDHALIESMDDDEIAGDDLESILKHGAQALFDEDYQKTAILYDSASVDKLLDRSQIEQTKTSDDGSAETQFSYARVWANDKLGFEDGVNVEEEKAPEPINSSVWDQILAQREEEARLEAEANKEVLGRGARRRMAINYKTNTADQHPLADEIGPESSDSSDDFEGGNNSPDESDDGMQDASKVDGNDNIHTLQKAPKATEVKGLAAAVPRKRGRPKRSEVAAPDTTKKPRRAAGELEVVQYGAPAQQWEQKMTAHYEKYLKVGDQAAQPHPQAPESARPQQHQYPQQYAQPLQPPHPHMQRPNNVVSSQMSIPNHRHFTHMVPQTAGAPYAYAANGANQPGHTNPTGVNMTYMSQLTTEAQLRLAMDHIHRSTANTPAKQYQLSVLHERLRDVQARNNPNNRQRA